MLSIPAIQERRSASFYAETDALPKHRSEVLHVGHLAK